MYSFFMAVLWGNLIVLLSYIAIKLKGFVSYSVLSLMIFLFLGLARLVLTIELPFVQVIRSDVIYNRIYIMLTYFVAEIAGFRITVGTLLLFIWIAAALILAVWEIRAYRKEWKVIQQFEIKRDPIAEELLDTIVTNKKKRRGLRVCRAERVGIPVIVGMIRPMIYLPMYGFNAVQLTGILLHESSHYRYKDNLLRNLTIAFCILFWWNPIVYLLKRNLHHTMEIRADQDVKAVFNEEEREIYLDCMNQIVDIYQERLRASSFTGFAGTIHNTRTQQRFDIMRDNRDRSRQNKVMTVGLYIVMFVLLVLSYTFIFQSYIELNEDNVFQTDSNNEGAGSPIIIGRGTDTNYLVDNGDGSYALYINDVFIKNITDISNGAYSSFEIREENP